MVLSASDVLEVIQYISKTYHSIIHLLIMSNIQIPDNIPHSDKLAAMELVAKMKAAADKAGVGFVGGFIAPDGTKFIQSNLDDDSDYENLLPDQLR